MPKITFLLALVCFAFTACGGNGDDSGASGGEGSGGGKSLAETDTNPSKGVRTYEGDGYSFSYPAEWDEQRPGIGSSTGTPSSETYLGLDNTNVLGLLVATGPVSITETNVADYQPEFFASATELFSGNGGMLTEGPTPVLLDGLPGVEFGGWLMNVDDVRVESRISWAFDGTTQYYMNCQFAPEHAEDMKRGCDQVRESFQIE